MDDFTIYGNTFEEALTDWDKLPQRCQETNLSLNHEKCYMLLTKIVLRHHIYLTYIKLDLHKVEIIYRLPMPKTQKNVSKFLGHFSYYRRFIENFTKVTSPLFDLLKIDS